MDFKSLGFDSLGAVEFRNRLKQAVGLPISTTAVFDHKTPVALVEHVLALMEPVAPAPAPAPVAVPAPAPEPDPDPLWPLSRYQQDVVTVALTYPDRPIAQPSGYIRLRGATDVERMKESIRRTAARHDAMRLRLERCGDEWRQRVLPDYPDVEVVSFRSEPDPRQACGDWIGRTTNTVITLDGPLVQTTVLIDDADSLIVYCRFHHAAADAWGINLVLEEICENYRVRGNHRSADGRPAPSCLAAVAADEEYRASADWRADRDALVGAIAELKPALFPARLPWAVTAGGSGRSTSTDGSSSASGARGARCSP